MALLNSVGTIHKNVDRAVHRPEPRWCFGPPQLLLGLVITQSSRSRTASEFHSLFHPSDDGCSPKLPLEHLSPSQHHDTRASFRKRRPGFSDSTINAGAVFTRSGSSPSPWFWTSAGLALDRPQLPNAPPPPPCQFSFQKS